MTLKPASEPFSFDELPPKGPQAPKIDLLAELPFQMDASRPTQKLQIKGYKLLKVAGRGSQAIVLKAQDLKQERVVALKILDPKLVDAAQFERFAKEARLLIGFEHPNIVKGYEFGESNGYCYFALEYLKGISAQQFLQKYPKMPTKQTLLTAEKITQALNYANSIHLVHRDIKPENIMIIGAFREIKLCDLGLAKALEGDKDLTQVGKVVGTPNFISPEIAQGKKSDIRSDLYSLGATLYYLSTGQLPFIGQTSIDVMKMHVLEELVPPIVRNRSVNPFLSELIVNMMEKEPINRPQTPEILLHKIERVRLGKSPKEISNFAEDGPDQSSLFSVPNIEELISEKQVETTKEQTSKKTRTPEKSPKSGDVKHSEELEFEEIIPVVNRSSPTSSDELEFEPTPSKEAQDAEDMEAGFARALEKNQQQDPIETEAIEENRKENRKKNQASSSKSRPYRPTKSLDKEKDILRLGLWIILFVAGCLIFYFMLRKP